MTPIALRSSSLSAARAEDNVNSGAEDETREGLIAHATKALLFKKRWRPETVMSEPALSLERLTEHRRPTGVSTQTPAARRTQVLLLQPNGLFRRLATLAPPPRHHLVRYHGVFAPNAAWRREVVTPPAGAF